MKKRVQNEYRETEPVTRFKMYKDGKNWVTSGVSNFLMWITPSRIVNGSSHSEKKSHTDGTAGADVKIMDRFFRHREVPDSENFSKPGFQLKTA
ncbi:KxYKxGKxW signal peptide domain-containing protein [Leuconostoc rapi]|uniref:KxYKxGKxW signal peptide domain-containing protein n=1 Tax=Leuconostoc rapi TaxID=1406906 RepID=UPI001959C2B7|nr:KxYKxGKxW signal peptide domain-containing protein [Leuconostoc rapi]MBM7435428.1 hypothetical protein [Leuconostoc rapi]